jgi:hypothetical protein
VFCLFYVEFHLSKSLHILSPFICIATAVPVLLCKQIPSNGVILPRVFYPNPYPDPHKYAFI